MTKPKAEYGPDDDCLELEWAFVCMGRLGTLIRQ